VIVMLERVIERMSSEDSDPRDLEYVIFDELVKEHKELYEAIENKFRDLSDADRAEMAEFHFLGVPFVSEQFQALLNGAHAYFDRGGPLDAESDDEKR
jgi:hypothetical protein